MCSLFCVNPNCIDDGKNTPHEQVNDAVTLIVNNSSLKADNIEHLRNWINEETTEVQEPSNDESIQCISTNPYRLTSSISNSDDSDTTEVEKSMAIVLKYLEQLPIYQKKITRSHIDFKDDLLLKNYETKS